MSAGKSGLPWSQADLALMREEYPKVETRVVDLAATLGRTVPQVCAKAFTLGLSRPAGGHRSSKRHGLRGVLLDAAAKPGGYAPIELTGFVSAHEVHAVTAALLRDGLIFRAKVSHKHVRYFATAVAAQSYEDAHKPKAPSVAISAAPAAGKFNAGPGSKSAWWPADAPMVITANTKITVAPSPPRVLRTNTHSQ